MEKQKKAIFKAQFNSLEINQEDPTLLKGKVIIHDFEKSWNNQVITEEVCSENMSTLIGKRIVCKYVPCEDNNGVDALKGHEELEGTDREGNPIFITDTIAIGFIENVYIDDYTDENGNTKRVLYGDVIIWNDDKYANIAGLLQEWISRGVKIHMSVEYLYINFNVVDGVEYLQSPILYVAHTLLNSEQRGDYAEILPAFDVSTLISLNERQKWNKAINQINKSDNSLDLNINNKEEDRMENIFLKSLNNLSFGDIRDKIYTELAKVMVASEFNYVWISVYDVFDTYFVYETKEGDSWVTYKVPYTKSENDVIALAYDQKSKAEFKGDWVAVTDYQVSQNSLQVANETIAKLQTELNTKDETIKTLNTKVENTKTEKDAVEIKFNEVTEKLTSLNSKVEEMTPLVEQYNTAKYEKALNEKMSYYDVKFKSVNAIEKFNTDEVKELIKASLNDNEEGKKATLQLNSMIVDLIEVKKDTNEVKTVKELNSKVENLIPVTNESFDDRYCD